MSCEPMSNWPILMQDDGIHESCIVPPPCPPLQLSFKAPSSHPPPPPLHNGRWSTIKLLGFSIFPPERNEKREEKKKKKISMILEGEKRKKKKKKKEKERYKIELIVSIPSGLPCSHPMLPCSHAPRMNYYCLTIKR